MSDVVQLTATAQERGLRVDQFLALKMPALSRARVQALLREGQVTIQGIAPKASYRIKGTEVVSVTIPPPVAAEPVAEDVPLKIIYQDRDLAVLDKAAGMVVHPGAGHTSGTLVNALLHHVKDLKGVGGELRPGIVHRLDKDTSGLIIVAKHEVSLRALQAAFKARTITKTYLALVFGQPPDRGTFRTLHARHPTQRKRFTGKLTVGKPAVTHFVVRQRFATAALVEISLETGRTHQIRMHFSEAGFPLLADALYGKRNSKQPLVINRQALHAWRLELAHPRTGQLLSFTAPPPDDFVEAQHRLT